MRTLAQRSWLTSPARLVLPMHLPTVPLPSRNFLLLPFAPTLNSPGTTVRSTLMEMNLCIPSAHLWTAEEPTPMPTADWTAPSPTTAPPPYQEVAMSAISVITSLQSVHVHRSCHRRDHWHTTVVGQYAIGIVFLIRDGVVEPTMRDFQFNVTLCDPNINPSPNKVRATCIGRRISSPTTPSTDQAAWILACGSI